MKIHTKSNDDLPAVHHTMGGTWVDYNLQTIPGCFIENQTSQITEQTD
jgi:succinate dehydrogenase/fumarate reductase flavoprotein subunit